MKRSLLLLLLAASVPSVTAQDAKPPTGQLPAADRINGADTLKAFTSAREVVAKSVVRVIDGDGALLAFGTAIDKDLVLSKRSALMDAEKIEVVLPGGEQVEPETVDKPDLNDLVLYRLPGAELEPVEFVPSEDLEQGVWLVSSSSEEPGIMAGVLAADRRDIARTSGVIGVFLGEDGDDVGGVQIRSIVPQGGAEAAGLQDGDIIVQVGEVKVKKRKDLQAELKKLDPGSMVAIKAKRDEEVMDFKVRLGHRGQIFGLFNKNQIMSGITSRRKTGYEGVLQHDIPLPANEMGGPILTVKGECVGINIARINRSENFALPSEIVRIFIDAENTPRVAAVDEPEDPEPSDPDPEPKDPDPGPDPEPTEPVEPGPGPGDEAEAKPVRDPMRDDEGEIIPPYELVP